MKKIWLDNYAPNVSHEITPFSQDNLAQLFDETCAKYPSNTAFINMGSELTFKEVNEFAEKFAAFLQGEVGLKPGDRIALQMPNILQFPIALFGALKAGLTIVNTNPLYTESEMEHQFNDSGAKAIVILSNFASKLEKVLGKTSIETVIVTQLGDLLGFPKSLLVNTVVKHVKKMVPNFDLPNAYTFHQAISTGEKHKFNPPTIQREDLAFLQYTGGTTGVSKGAMLTHNNILSNVKQIKEVMTVLLEENKEIIVTALPLYHIFSLTANFLNIFTFGGTNLLITNPKDIKGFIKTLAKYDYTIMTGVNTLYNALLNHPDFQSLDFKTLKISIAGGMALQSSVHQSWVDKTNSPLIEGYGLTECSPVVNVNPLDGTDVVGTIGMPLPSTDVKLIDDDGHEVTEPQTPGELCTKGPQVMKGYWQRPEESQNCLDSEGWFKTGDIAIFDDKGYFKIVDRKKDMILVSGFNVYPNEVEDVVCKMEGVLEAAAIGVPDEKSGEVVKIFVVKKRKSVTKEDIIAHCKEHLTGYKIPRAIEFKDELPKTNVGKILRRALKD